VDYTPGKTKIDWIASGSTHFDNGETSESIPWNRKGKKQIGKRPPPENPRKGLIFKGWGRDPRLFWGNLNWGWKGFWGLTSLINFPGEWFQRLNHTTHPFGTLTEQL